MIRIVSIEISGRTERGPFSGKLEFENGLNVYSGENAFGKSTAVTAIPWCLGIEPMFGLQNNDPARFPGAVRDAITLDGVENIPVLASEACISIERHDGACLALRRAIHGGDREKVEVTETKNHSKKVTVLQARKETMSDETAGLQRFLFEWMGLPRTPLMTLNGRRSELYLENLAPLFFIDQTEGWTDLFALQVHRYGLQEVNEAAVEFLLGARAALAHRFKQQENVSAEARLKGEAAKIRERVESFFNAQGWTLAWSTRGSSTEIAKRWGEAKLSDIARKDFNMNVPAERERLTKRLASLRDALAKMPAGAADRGPASQASQEVVDLTTKRHEHREELRQAILQLAEQQALLETIEHRIASSKDVLKLKVQGIGRLDQVECPTCHRELEPSSFQLTQQSTDSVGAHIEALEKQRVLIRHNIAALHAEENRLKHALSEVDDRLLAADRALATVNLAVGATRESLAKIAGDITSTEKELSDLTAYMREMDALEEAVQRWLSEVHAVAEGMVDRSDLKTRVVKFEEKLRAQLLALGHSAVSKANVAEVRLDDRYIPYLGPRRLRSLGSASDHPRLVAAYVLALAQASRALDGPHPGIVILDEPQQQNPDDRHVELFLQFLVSASKDTKTQVVVTTFLKKDEPAKLREAKVNVRELPRDRHFLELVPGPGGKRAGTRNRS
ncbi:MAG: AAA family ATPase [Kofleriaceae bacterium]|nr:AAA family ATPase [Kofleriaceae bacterium]